VKKNILALRQPMSAWYVYQGDQIGRIWGYRAIVSLGQCFENYINTYRFLGYFSTVKDVH
jgi:hypothetical protein